MKALKLDVEWIGNGKKACVTVNETGDPNEEFILLHKDEGNLNQCQFREKVIAKYLELATEGVEDESVITATRKLVDNLLMTELEKRSSSISSTPSPKLGRNSPSFADQLATTDIANAHRLACRYGHCIRYCGKLGSWFIYDGKRWSPDETNVIVQCAKDTAAAIYAEAQQTPSNNTLGKHAVNSQQRRAIDSMIALAKPDVAVRHEQFDADIWLLSVQNGTIDLRTGMLWPHDPRHFITKLSPATYDVNATCPLFDKFMNTIFAGQADVIEYVLRILGWCLTGDIQHHILPIFHGAGANGKSTLIEAVMYLMGEHATIAPDSLICSRSSDEHATEFADLRGRRMVVASETDEGRRLKNAQVKKLTGDGIIKGRMMRQDFFEFPRTHKTILITNNRPRITEDSEGMWRRLKLIKFGVVIPPSQRDSTLPQKLRAEASGILNRLVSACLRWQHEGYNLREPDSVKVETSEYRLAEDPIAEFIEQKTVLGGVVSRNDLYRAYQVFCASTGNNFPLGQRQVFERARKLPGVEDGTAKIGGDKVRIFKGLSLSLPQPAIQFPMALPRPVENMPNLRAG